MLILEVEPHARRLMTAALTHVRDCLEHYAAESEHRRRAIAGAGAASELSAKAHLAHLSPVLVADKSANFDTLRHLNGNSRLAEKPISEIRTVGGIEACERVKAVLPSYQFTPQDMPVFQNRNAAFHAGFPTQMLRNKALASWFV